MPDLGCMARARPGTRRGRVFDLCNGFDTLQCEEALLFRATAVPDNLTSEFRFMEINWASSGLLSGESGGMPPPGRNAVFLRSLGAGASSLQWCHCGSIRSGLTSASKPLMFQSVAGVGSIRFSSAHRRPPPAVSVLPTVLTGAAEMSELPENLIADPEAVLRFETLISDVFGRTLRMPADRIDREIEAALGEAGAILRADRCELLCIRADEGLGWHSRAWHAEGFDRVPSDMDLVALFPWMYREVVLEGRPCAIRRVEDLPWDAQQDRQSLAAMGVRSHLSVPLGFRSDFCHVFVAQTLREELSWPEAFIPRLRVLGELLLSALRRKAGAQGPNEFHAEQTAHLIEANERLSAAKEELQERLRFESLVADISARFVNLPSEQIDDEILDAQRRICTCLGLDMSTLWQRLPGAPGSLSMTHIHRPPGGPPIPERFDAQERFPWILRQLLEGRVTVVESTENLPTEAEVDQATWRRFGVKTSLGIPLSVGGGALIGTLSFNDTMRERRWPQALVNRLELIAQTFANAIARRQAEEELKRANEELAKLQERLRAESAYLQTELKVSGNYGEIIGQSRAIREVLAKVEQVARTDSAVLVTGETGTGKELIARAIHGCSDRKNRAMVTVNCAALPPGLVEGELFGREKGAYTGALTKQIGRFEIADSSTLFLDEIAELPLELQAKLLRVLQDGKFERLGSSKTLQSNVRVIAATNHDLLEDVRKGSFRRDLYYRINVFPIALPPLRERTEDIPLLVQAFVNEFRDRMGKRVCKVPMRTLKQLSSYPWMGNIRELRNVIENAVIRSEGDTLDVRLPDEEGSDRQEILVRKQIEKQYIQKALERSGWRVKGPGGAAELLGMKPSTLYSMMRRLGIPTRRRMVDNAT